MFSLVVAVVSVALVAVLAIAGILYAGSAFQNGGIRAMANQVINAGSQVDGAQALRETETGAKLVDDAATGAALDGLVSEGYLNAVPAVPARLAETGASWTYAVPPGGSRPVLALKLDDSNASVSAFCTEVSKTKGYACTSDLSTVGAGQ